MIADRKGIDCRPQPPATPFPDMRMDRASHNQGDEVAGMRANDGKPTLVGLVADPCKEKYHDQRQGSADCGQCIRGNSREPKRPCDGIQYHLKQRSSHNLHDDARCVRSQRAPGRKDSTCGDKMWPSAIMAYSLPHGLGRDVHSLSAIPFFGIIEL